MNTQSNAMPGSLDAQRVAPAVLSPSRPMYWSVRRELWENRSIYIAPLAVAGVFLFGFLISTIHLPARMRALSALCPAQQRDAIALQFSVLLPSTVVSLGSALNVATLSTQLSSVQMSLPLLYHRVTVHALWPAPTYASLLLVSGSARRAAFL